MGQLILLRHGQSNFNEQNRFTGFLDVDLSEKGVLEAQRAAKLLASTPFDFVFTSVLKRAIRTAHIILDQTSQSSVTVIQNAALNERHYGDLQGLNKDEVRRQYGEEQVHIWRRSYATRPPNGESLKDTCERVIPYYKQNILPLLQKDKTVLVAAHGNSLRGLIKELEHISDDDIVQVEIPTGVPIVYTLDAHGTVLTKRILD